MAHNDYGQFDKTTKCFNFFFFLNISCKYFNKLFHKFHKYFIFLRFLCLKIFRGMYVFKLTFTTVKQA